MTDVIKAISLRIRAAGILSVIAIYRQLGGDGGGLVAGIGCHDAGLVYGKAL